MILINIISKSGSELMQFPTRVAAGKYLAGHKVRGIELVDAYETSDKFDGNDLIAEYHEAKAHIEEAIREKLSSEELEYVGL